MSRSSLITCALVAAAAALTAASAPNTLSPEEQKEGFRLLFDGKSLAGWRGFKQEAPGAGWQVVDGAITRVGKAGDLITVEKFADFDLRWEWRIARNGNSGVFYRVAEGPDLETVWRTGPEYQLLHNEGHPDGRNGPDRFSGANYALQAPSVLTTKPVGEWNTSRIVVRGPHVEHWLNGVKVVEYELWSDAWKAQVAGSKFRTMPRYGMEKTGHIALQDHGDEVAFRSIRIKELKDS